MKTKILVFGTGSGWIKIKKVINFNLIDIIAFVDNNKCKEGMVFENKKVIGPQKIEYYSYDYILICSEYYNEISLQLKSLGICDDKILEVYKPSFEFAICNFFDVDCLIEKSISGENNSIECNTSSIKNLKIKIFGNNNKIVVDNKTIITNATIGITGNNNILRIHSNAMIFNTCFGYVHNCESCSIEIGEKTSINGASFLVAEKKNKIVVGEDCMMSDDISIMASDTHSIIDIDSNKRINYAEDIIISDHVWICHGASVLKGSSIGENCIVALNSVVTKKFPENSIIAGNPAKVVKKNTKWERELKF